nr:DUF6472 family protein [uncultured Agathobaculum sp.]
MVASCNSCVYNVYDDELDEYACEAYLDEDEYCRLLQNGGICPYYRAGDNYQSGARPVTRG